MFRIILIIGYFALQHLQNVIYLPQKQYYVKLAVLKETRANEPRVALTPSVVQSFVKAGFEVTVESEAGMASSYSDEAYVKAGAKIASSVADLYNNAQVVIKMSPPQENEVQQLPQGCSLISLIYGSMNAALVQQLNQKQISVFAMDAIPRISRAQNMDALSSQSNLAGYKAVLLGANHMQKIFPLMMTAAGTITPSRVLIFGAGVAGLQAVATAKRLGAIVEVTDVRPETKEQVESLGGKFIEVKSDDAVKVEGGYAKEVSAEYLQKQKEAVNKSLFQADLVITTALVMGKKAPVLITEEQVKQMKRIQNISCPTLTQAAIAHFLKHGRYEYHLKNLRKALHTQSLRYVQAIIKYFPPDTKVSRPQGGFILWLELNKKINAFRLRSIAMEHKISIVPGKIFSSGTNYTNCIRLSFGKPWSKEVDEGLMMLGKLIKEKQG